MAQSSVLITGSTGYIGSHTWVELINAGYRVVGIDNFSNSSPHVLRQLARLTGSALDFVEMDARDTNSLANLMSQRDVKSVIHFAAHKAVSTSSREPLSYYQNNLGGLMSVCEAMAQTRVSQLVFSSSATVYGQPDQVPIPESAALRPTNPYGQTKLMGETMLRDVSFAQNNWRVACLRYFNPVGAHPSGLIGEDPRDIPDNLMPLIARVAVGRADALPVYGNDYDTPDGTGVRDYIHVSDVARAHVAAAAYLQQHETDLTLNIGTGVGHSVLEVVRAYEQVCGRSIPITIMPRRRGDIASCYANPAESKVKLKWQAIHDLARMCEDSWRWQSQNPDGYQLTGKF